VIIGQTLDWGGAGATYFSPWFPRGGSGARFTVEIIDVSSACLAEERRRRITRNMANQASAHVVARTARFDSGQRNSTK
jgi:hypothetical protein